MGFMFHLWMILILISKFYASQKEIDWSCYFAGKENLFLFVNFFFQEKKYAFCTDIWIVVTFEVSTHCIIAFNSISQKGIQSRYHLAITETLYALIVKWHKYFFCLNYLTSFSLGVIYQYPCYLINNQALNLYFYHFSVLNNKEVSDIGCGILDKVNIPLGQCNYLGFY